MKRKRTNPDFLNGVPELLVLKLLTEQPMYGYQIVEALRTRSDEVFQFGEGSIYPVLHRLEAEKLLSSRRKKVNQRERVVYRTTAAGRKRLAHSQDRWQQVADAIRSMMEGESHGRPAVL